jgi:hypothetical protein
VERRAAEEAYYQQFPVSNNIFIFQWVINLPFVRILVLCARCTWLLEATEDEPTAIEEGAVGAWATEEHP